MPTIHHLGFLVRDLAVAVERYTQLLGVEPVATEALRNRGVITARFSLGSVWLVLIEPITEDSIPARHLARYGEGFFMLSLNSNDLKQTDQELIDRGMSLNWSTLRQGLSDWRVADLKDWESFGAVIQFAESNDDDEAERH